MLPYPAATSAEEKRHFMEKVKNRLLEKHGDDILAVGVYGSVGQGSDGPFSDIGLHVVRQSLLFARSGL